MTFKPQIKLADVGKNATDHKPMKKMADGGFVSDYDTEPDMADGGRTLPGPAFKKGGAARKKKRK